MTIGKKESTQASVEEIARIAHEISGIQLSLRHRSMIESRLFRRISELKLSGLDEYVAYLKGNLAGEKKTLISLLTTHHTYFFREMNHFEFLREEGLKNAVAALKREGRNELRIWSAACSKGQEVYSLAMWILPWLEQNAPGVKLRILGSDVDEASVNIAANGVYARSELEEVPLSLLGDYWAKGSGDIADYAKAKKSLRGCAEFRVENLFSLSASQEKFDFIFCRNVFIYFSQEQIKAIVKNFLPRLTPAGHLMIGISESLSGYDLPLVTAGPSIYRQKNAASEKAKTTTSAPAAAKAKPVERAPLRVLCVDDSPTIVTVMKKILQEKGFEFVGSCVNGQELHERLAKGGVDVVTLDIHMPVMDGVEYLRRHWKKGHVPVVMVSSVSREDSELALTALRLGAADYVEKPSLSDLSERAEEIRNKIKCAASATQRPATFDLQMGQKVGQWEPAKARRVVLFSLSDRARVTALLRAMPAHEENLVLLVEGSAGALAGMSGELARDSGRRVVTENAGARDVTLADAKTFWPKLTAESSKLCTSFLVLGDLADATARKISSLHGVQILLEDTAAVPASLLGKEVHHFPITSFLYQSEEFFGRRAKKVA